jgi:hypothetical protein
VSDFADDSVKGHILRWTCYWRDDKELLQAVVCSSRVWGRGSTSDGGCSTGVKTWFPEHQPDTYDAMPGEQMASARCCWCSRYDRHRTLANH